MTEKYSQCLEKLTKNYKSHKTSNIHQNDSLKPNHVILDPLSDKTLAMKTFETFNHC